MIDQVMALPDQLRWATEVDVPAIPAASRVVISGMGGSAMAGDAAAVACDASEVAPVHRGYGLPAWADPATTLAILVSYSGDTEETISAADAAQAVGQPVAVVASGGELMRRARAGGWPAIEVPGGLQPRAAVGYQAGAVLRVLHGTGMVVDPRPELAGAAEVAEATLEEAAGLADDLADALTGRIAVCYGGVGIPSVAARRWKTQINENAKMPAFAGELPEMNHNELVAWGAAPESITRGVALVFLRDPFDHPRVARRVDLTRDLIGSRVTIAGEVVAQGEGPLARLFSLFAVGDLTSLRLAERAGVDPEPVHLLETFKKRLREE